MNSETARDFRIQFRQARDNALRDAEAFDEIIYVIERLGIVLTGQMRSLGQYQSEIKKFADDSPLANYVPNKHRDVHTPFNLLYDIVTEARNDALHIGAFARHLTSHAIEVAIVLEDALRTKEENKLISDYMVPNPVCAALWQPISFIRQRMLASSFSYLPVKTSSEQ